MEGRHSIHAKAVMITVVLAAVLVVTLAGCGKKTAPIPPEDAPPGKHEQVK